MKNTHKVHKRLSQLWTGIIVIVLNRALNIGV